VLLAVADCQPCAAGRDINLHAESHIDCHIPTVDLLPIKACYVADWFIDE
jgi:hypothetical protein